MKMNERVGQIFTNTQGCEFQIIQYNTCKKVTIQFLDEHKYTRLVTYQACELGEVINPFYKSVYNVGYIGLDTNGNRVKTTGKNKKAYNTWYNMMYRCYCTEFHEKYPTYKNCIVCERWHCFARFLEDLPSIEGYNYWLKNNDVALDKDLKGKNVYSLSTCCFVSRSVNSKERDERRGTPIKKKPLKATNINTGEIIYFKSTVDAEKQGFCRKSIRNCINGKIQGYKGYNWEFVHVERDDDEEWQE